MTFKKGVTFFAILLSMLISFSILSSDVLDRFTAQKVHNISLISRSSNSESWASIRQGAEQAALEYQAQLSFITLTSDNMVSEQIELMEREAETGADAVIISAADSSALILPTKKISKKIPLVFLESEIENNTNTTKVLCDDFGMGKTLGEEIAKNCPKDAKIAVLVPPNNLNKNMRDRIEGLQQHFGKSNIEEWVLSTDKVNAQFIIRDKLLGNPPYAVVALEASYLELASQVIDNLSSPKSLLYGIGTNEKIASYIEKGVVKAAVAQNNFSLGYLCVKSAIDALNKRTPDINPTIQFRLVTFENMYDIENQRILFPFVK